MRTRVKSQNFFNQFLTCIAPTTQYMKKEMINKNCQVASMLMNIDGSSLLEQTTSATTILDKDYSFPFKDMDDNSFEEMGSSDCVINNLPGHENYNKTLHESTKAMFLAYSFHW